MQGSANYDPGPNSAHCLFLLTKFYWELVTFIHLRRVYPSLGASPVAQMVKHLPAMQETQVQFLSQEDSLEKGMVTHSSILVWKIRWTEEPGGLQFIGSQRVRHNWATNHAHTHSSFNATIMAELNHCDKSDMNHKVLIFFHYITLYRKKFSNLCSIQMSFRFIICKSEDSN